MQSLIVEDQLLMQCAMLRTCTSLVLVMCCSIEAQPESAVSPGTSISVSAKIRRNQAAVASVTLLALVNYEAEQRIPMTASGSEGVLLDSPAVQAVLQYPVGAFGRGVRKGLGGGDDGQQSVAGSGYFALYKVAFLMLIRFHYRTMSPVCVQQHIMTQPSAPPRAS
jgi:hypothetical protein